MYYFLRRYSPSWWWINPRVGFRSALCRSGWWVYTDLLECRGGVWGWWVGPGWGGRSTRCAARWRGAGWWRWTGGPSTPSPPPAVGSSSSTGSEIRINSCIFKHFLGMFLVSCIMLDCRKFRNFILEEQRISWRKNLTREIKKNIYVYYIIL